MMKGEGKLTMLTKGDEPTISTDKMIINEDELNTLAENTKKILEDGSKHERIRETVAQVEIDHVIVKVGAHQNATILANAGVGGTLDQEDAQQEG